MAPRQNDVKWLNLGVFVVTFLQIEHNTQHTKFNVSVFNFEQGLTENKHFYSFVPAFMAGCSAWLFVRYWKVGWR